MGRSVPSSGWLLRLLLPPPCSFWMTLSISAISRERKKPANQDRNKSAPAPASGERLQTLEEGPHRLLSAPVASRLLTGHAALASGVVTVVSPTTLTLGRSIAQQHGMPSYGPRHAAHLLGLPRVGSED